MNEDEAGRHLARFLDHDAEGMDQGLIRRLEDIRAAALMRDETRHAGAVILGPRAAPVLSSAGSRALVPALILSLLVGGYFWRERMDSRDIDEFELLSDELPVNAYIDRGFQQWISASLQR